MYQFLRKQNWSSMAVSPPVTPRLAVECPKSVREKETFVWKTKIKTMYGALTTPWWKIKVDMARDLYI